MKKRLFATTLTMALVASLMTGCSSGKAADSATPVVAEMARTEGGESSKDAGNSSDAVADKVGTAANKTGPSGKARALVGVTMPTRDLQRWDQDGANMKAELEAADYKVDLQYASNSIQTQISQVESMISSDYQMPVIVSINGSSLDEPLGQVKETEIPVISYGRLIMNSDAVTYYATFDNCKVGWKQGEYLVKVLRLKTAIEPKNIGLFAGDSADNNCSFFFGGTIGVLQKYIDKGKLVIESDQTTLEQVAIANWDPEKAQNRADTIVVEDYLDGTVLDAMLCSNNSIAPGVENVLVSSYTGTYPVITDQDCDIANVKSMLGGKQTMSVLKDTRILITQVVKMVDAAMQGGEAGIDDSSSYDSGTGVVPTYLCEPVVVIADNCKEILVDSGCYTEDQIKQISIQKRIPLPIKRREKINFRNGRCTEACLDCQTHKVGLSQT